MALSRRTGQRLQGSIWPGFVDAVTGLLMVLVFVLTIFMVMQYVLRETISGQDKRLDSLSSEIAALAQALGLEQRRSEALSSRVGE
ncbi:MAG: peptidoglycan-binding protein, partial [Lutimaribacter sp.]